MNNSIAEQIAEELNDYQNYEEVEFQERETFEEWLGEQENSEQFSKLEVSNLKVLWERASEFEEKLEEEIDEYSEASDCPSHAKFVEAEITLYELLGEIQKKYTENTIEIGYNLDYSQMCQDYDLPDNEYTKRILTPFIKEIDAMYGLTFPRETVEEIVNRLNSTIEKYKYKLFLQDSGLEKCNDDKLASLWMEERKWFTICQEEHVDINQAFSLNHWQTANDRLEKYMLSLQKPAKNSPKRLVKAADRIPEQMQTVDFKLLEADTLRQAIETMYEFQHDTTSPAYINAERVFQNYKQDEINMKLSADYAHKRHCYLNGR
ncbi:MAG: hypothetical protein ACRCYT_02000 [Cetobacterium sp.]